MGRRMKIKMDNEIFSSLRDVNGGSPQGTLLGNYLFIITTDDLEEKLTPTEEMTGDSV